MKVRMCRCFMCKYGLRNSKKEKIQVRRLCRGARRRNRQLLKAGQYERMTEAVSIPYIG